MAQQLDAAGESSAGGLLDSDLWVTCSSVYGRECTILKCPTGRYLIGAQISLLLNKETFNLYRSMKVKGIELIRADPEQITYLAKICAVKKGTRSVTLIPFESGAEFVEAELRRQRLSNARSTPNSKSGPAASDPDEFYPSKRIKREEHDIKPWEILLCMRESSSSPSAVRGVPAVLCT